MVLPKADISTGCVGKAGCIINCDAIGGHGRFLQAGVHVPGSQRYSGESYSTLYENQNQENYSKPDSSCAKRGHEHDCIQE